MRTLNIFLSYNFARSQLGKSHSLTGPTLARSQLGPNFKLTQAQTIFLLERITQNTIKDLTKNNYEQKGIFYLFLAFQKLGLMFFRNCISVPLITECIFKECNFQSQGTTQQSYRFCWDFTFQHLKNATKVRAVPYLSNSLTH